MEINEEKQKFHITRFAPTHKIKSRKLAEYSKASECEDVVQVGIFFDGTGNNVHLHKGENRHSNIARLYQAYASSPEGGRYSIYIPGLGTPFPEIGESTATIMGAAFARGGESRIIFALLSVFNAINFSIFNKEFFSQELRRALCTRDLSSSDKRQLQKIGLNSSLADGYGRERTLQYLNVCQNSMMARIKENTNPRIVECIIDIFGFSRGATEARVFCHWLNDLLNKYGLAGIPLRFRFLGLMDTVASVGFWEAVRSDQLRRDGGHSSWAMAEVMRILPNVENCVHFVAMHEIRKNFPLDTVIFNSSLPENCVEYVYPGSHSDVGGGYKPGELGVSSDDSLKLSQIPLNHMFECAVTAGVPLSKGRFDVQKAFAIHRDLATAVQQFIDISREEPRALSEWMLPYLVWRWQIRHTYPVLGQATRANPNDKRNLLDGNEQFCWHDDLIRYYNLSKNLSSRLPYDRDKSSVTLMSLEPEAPQIRRRIISEKTIEPELAKFFDRFVHDSLAGFRGQMVEKTGFWRCRRVFYGSDTPFAE